MRCPTPPAARPGAFHPRCPRAAAACGWEGRGLRALLEQRCTALPEAGYEGESALVGDMSALDGAGRRVTVAGRDPGEVVRLLERVRADDQAEPLWRGIASITSGNGEAVVEFYPGADPALLPAGGAEVACHLHDPARDQEGTVADELPV